MSGAILWLAVLSSLRKQSEQAMRTKSLRCLPPWSLHQVLPPRSCPAWAPVLTFFNDEQWSLSQINPFLFNLFWIETIITIAIITPDKSITIYVKKKKSKWIKTLSLESGFERKHGGMFVQSQECGGWGRRTTSFLVLPWVIWWGHISRTKQNSDFQFKCLLLKFS